MKNCKNCGVGLGESRGSKHHYCSVKCQQAWRHTTYIERWKRGEEEGKKGKFGVSAHIRRHLFERHNNKCSKCGWGETNPYSGKIPLEINHIDGDWQNNGHNNLELICPNCHALTPTHRGLNMKGNGRYTSGMKQPVYRN